MKASNALLKITGVALFLSFALCIPVSYAQETVHFYAQPPIRVITGPGENPPGPPLGAETPGSMACIYKLVKQTKGCPVTSKPLPSTKGVGSRRAGRCL
jgi:hypothetical protein